MDLIDQLGYVKLGHINELKRFTANNQFLVTELSIIMFIDDLLIIADICFQFLSERRPFFIAYQNPIVTHKLNVYSFKI